MDWQVGEEMYTGLPQPSYLTSPFLLLLENNGNAEAFSSCVQNTRRQLQAQQSSIPLSCPGLVNIFAEPFTGLYINNSTSHRVLIEPRGKSDETCQYGLLTLQNRIVLTTVHGMVSGI